MGVDSYPGIYLGSADLLRRLDMSPDASGELASSKGRRDGVPGGVHRTLSSPDYLSPEPDPGNADHIRNLGPASKFCCLRDYSLPDEEGEIRGVVGRVGLV